jgi:hypothetical protein
MSSNNLLESKLAGVTDLFIQQTLGHIKGEGLCGCCCCEIQNQYLIYEGPYMKDKKLEEYKLIADVKERSKCCERICCEPMHSLRLGVAFPDTGPEPQLTLERPGICNGKCCLGGCACMDCCIDEMTLYDKPIAIDADYRDPANAGNIIMKVSQAPAMQAMIHPTIIATRPGSDAEITTITGPMFFGGCSELCFTSEFNATAGGQQLGSVNKIRPDGCCAMCMEICTDSDRFTVNFGSANNEQKVALFASAFLTDFMVFENEQHLCGCNDNSCYIHMCNSYCCGMICPCKIIIPKPQN